MKRRTWLLAGTGTAAAAVGVGWQWRLEQGRVAEQAAAAAGAASGPADGAHALWAMRFDQPDGGTLVMSTLRGQPLLLNFWGTWCPPCVKEMPELDQFARQHKARGWTVVGLAVDNVKAVRDFLARQPVSYPVGMAGFDGSAMTRTLGNTQGGLPFTVAFDRQGAVFRRKAGATTLEELSVWAREL